MDQTAIKSLIEQVIREIVAERGGTTPPPSPPSSPTATVTLNETGAAERGQDPREVVIGLSPAFSSDIFETIIGLPHGQVLKEIAAGIEEEGLTHRIVKIYRTADVGFVAHEAAKLSGSGVGIGIQSRGTTVIHQRDLAPLSNLELFSQAPLIDLETFRAIGKNAAKYAKGESPSPVPVRNDQMARPKYQAIAALLHNKETKLCQLSKKTQAVTAAYV
ncbi:propanediol/glycerol family dehydratase medium subunit [Tessaracoccus massiliensis]|uniref:propanediol/glycerol family dehydratase medium subunit n=1 Tax=Tessaracoccus massiliensis TaxID=1522311 RepID=UPI00059043B5|nr:propanediol/glycerol family dehydratase medium subunit [Tessaracoccus massiliensis]